MQGRHPRTLLLTALVVVGLLSLPTAVRARGHSEQSLVRFAHFAPEVATGDIYVLRVNNRVRMNDIPYGAVSDYLELAPGTYTFELRNARAPASAASEHRVTVRLAPGDVKTIFMYGPHPKVWSSVVDDVARRPTPGTTRIRAVNALSGRTPVTITTQDGEVIARGLRPGAASPYVELPAGPRTLLVSDRAGKTIARTERVMLRPGATLSVAANGGGGKPRSVVGLLESAAARPAGRMDLGAGGTAADHPGAAGPAGFRAGQGSAPSRRPGSAPGSSQGLGHGPGHLAGYGHRQSTPSGEAVLIALFTVVAVLLVAKVVTLGTLRRLEPGRHARPRRRPSSPSPVRHHHPVPASHRRKR